MKAIYQLQLLGFTLCISLFSFSQQEGQFASTVNNPFILNPAAGGLSNVIQIDLNSRTQWTGYNGGPRSMILTGHSPIKVGKKTTGKVIEEFNTEDATLFASPEISTGAIKHVVGGKLMVESIGPFNRTTFHGNYSIHLPFSKSINFGAGLGLGWSNFGINQDRVVLYESDDNAYSQFLGNTTSQSIFDANAGIVFYNEDLFVGLSSSQLFNNDVVFSSVPTASNFNRHYYIVGKYKISAGDQFQIQPTAVLKLAKNVPFSGDFGAQLIYNKSSWFGVQYRTGNALVFQVGSNLIKNFYLSYAYEQSIGAIQTSGNGTHELHLGIYIGKNRNIGKELKEDKGE